MLEESVYGNVPDVKYVQRVVVPTHVNHYLPNGAILPSTPSDTRRFVRRASNLQAYLEILDSWRLDPAAERYFLVPVMNISRSGACFLHHHQLYPSDRMVLDFGSLRREYTVARCRRINAECYEIGVQVL